MGAYILRRLAQAIPVLFGVSILVFAMSHLVPGDPVAVMLGDRATAQDVERLRHQLGLDRPIYVQYVDYLWRVLHGDLGTSIRSGQPVAQEILAHLPATMQLAVAAAFLAVLIGVTAGVIAATTTKRAVDLAVMTLVLLGISTPTFFSGLLLILVFALKLDLLPVVEGGGIKALILPALTLALPASAVLARMARSSMLEEIRRDYVRTAFSKGLRSRTIVAVHVLRNALIPVVTIVGLQFGGLMAGTVIVESVFARSGLGRYAVTAINARDFPQIQGIVLVVATIYVLVNLAVDLLYAAIDPRIRYR